MGQKVNPISFRLPVTNDWDSVWFAKGRVYVRNLEKDFAIRAYIKKHLRNALVSRVIIKRKVGVATVVISSARPGMIIGKNGADVHRLKQDLSELVSESVDVDIVEVKKPETQASLIAESIAMQLRKRVSFRRCMRKAIQGAMRYGVGGIRVNCSGRLGGAEIARMEWHREGRVPLHTIRADVEYAVSEAKTTYGIIGVKVWVYKGNVS